MEENLWVTIITIMFTLSLISERLSNLIKLNWPRLREKRHNNSLEKKRERDILLLALFCGLATALLAGADFFYLIENGKLYGIKMAGSPTSNGTNNLDIGRSVVGCILTGLFISLGSKFWHDVLDIVLQFSNLQKYRQRGGQEETVRSIDAIEIKNLYTITENSLNDLEKISGFQGYNILIDNKTNKPFVLLKFSEKLPNRNEQKIIQDNFPEGNFSFVKVSEITTQTL